MEFLSTNDRFTMTRKKAARLCLEYKYMDAQQEWDDFLESVKNQNPWDIRRYAETCISQLPGYFKGYLFAGIACLDLEEYSSALSYFIKALDIDPKNIRALKHKSEVLYVMDRYEEALQCAEILLTIDLYNPDYISLALRNLVMMDRHQESLVLIDEGLRNYPGNCNLLMEKAMMHDISRDIGGAMELYTKAEQSAKRDPLSSQLISTLILLHLNRGGMRKNNCDRLGGENEINLGYVLIELEKARIFENRSN